VLVNPHYASTGKLGGGEALSKTSRLGKLGQPGRTSTGVGEADVARLALQHCSAMSGVVQKKRKVVEAIVLARKREPEVWLPARRSNSCRSRQAASGLE